MYANSRDPKAVSELDNLIEKSNPIISALGVESLSRNFPLEAVERSVKLIGSSEDLVRHQALTSIPVSEKNIYLFEQALSDPLLAIRTRSAFKLTPYEDKISKGSKSLYEKVLEEYKESSYYNFDFPQTKMNFAILAYNQGKLEEAEKYILKVQQQDHLFLDSYVYLGYIYNQMGKREKAIGQFKQYLHYNPYDAQRNYELALLLAEDKNFKGAENYLKKALVHSPKNARFMLNLAKIYETNRKLEKAEDMFMEVIDQNPKQKQFYMELVSFYKRTNDKQKAQRVIETVYQRFGTL